MASNRVTRNLRFNRQVYEAISSSYVQQQQQQPFICRACYQASTLTPTRTTPRTKPSFQVKFRPLSTSHNLLKKSSSNPKSARKSPPIETPTKSQHIPDNKHTRNLDAEPDPYDHTTLQSAIDQALARLRDALTKTRDAGRVSASMIEDLSVELSSGNNNNSSGNNSTGGNSKQRTYIRDIASVVPKGGRQMQVFLSEASHIKPVTTAIQASPYSLAPHSDATNPLLLNIAVPPATAETRQQAVNEAKKCFDRASLDVRNARGDAQKRHKRMEQEKIVVPDELRKAHKSMDEVAKKGQDEVKKVFDAAVKALQNV